MKNPNRNVVVEYKNRRVRKDSASLWGNLDLKSIAQEVDSLSPKSSMDKSMGSSRPHEIKSEPKAKPVKILPNMALDKKTVGGELLSSDKIDVVLSQGGITSNSRLSAHIAVEAKEINEGVRGLSVLAAKKTLIKNINMAVKHAVADDDVRAELALLEKENASLKLELLAKLSEENKCLVAMRNRLVQRTTDRS